MPQLNEIWPVLMVFAFCQAKAETAIEVGSTLLSDSNSHGGMLLLTERYGKWAFGLAYVSEQEVNVPCGTPLPRTDRCDFELRENIMVHVMREFPLGRRCDFGIGPAFYQNTNRALGKQFTIGLKLACNVAGNLWLVARHNSNAGSGTPNLGQDALLFEYRFAVGTP